MHSILKKVVWICLLIVPFVALYVASGNSLDIVNWGTSGFYFPFITGKNLLFRLLVEIAFFSWVALALSDPKYRLQIKKSPLLIAYAVFMVVLLAADLFGINPFRSFWSNFERMEGFVAHLHFFAYFIVLSAMLHTAEDYGRMFKAFIISNVLVLVYAYGQLLGAKGYIFSQLFPTLAARFSTAFPIHMSENRLDATLGNSAYFAAYCLTFVFIAALMWLHDKGTKRAKLYPILIVLNLIALFYTGTRGTQVGILVGGFVTLGLIGWFEKGKIRKMVVGVLVIVSVLVASIFVFKNTNLVKNSPTLARFASISPQDLTGMSRLSMWKISYEAWKERPILGYGQENFSSIFAAKFDPVKMSVLEPWYDRSHDVFFDWLVAAGALGLISYLSLYIVAMYLMWIRKNDMPLREKAILTGAFVGYFIHNVFVFDNLISYILFFFMLAYIAFRTGTRGGVEHGKAVKAEHMNALYLPLLGILLIASVYVLVYRPVMVNKLLVKGLDVNRFIQTMSFPDVVHLQKESFEKAIAMNTLGSEEAREQYYQMSLRMAQVTIPAEVSPEDKQRAVDALNDLISGARADIEKSFEAHKNDVRMLSLYGMFYNGLGDGVSAEKPLSLAHSLAPKKQLVSFDLVRSYLLQGKVQEAYTLAQETYDLSPAYAEASKIYLLAAIYSGKWEEAKAHIASQGGMVAFDPDLLSALVETKQINAAIGFLNDFKRQQPEYAAQVDAYIKQLLAPTKK
jgi:O-antigen ligase